MIEVTFCRKIPTRSCVVCQFDQLLPNEALFASSFQCYLLKAGKPKTRRIPGTGLPRVLKRAASVSFSLICMKTFPTEGLAIDCSSSELLS